MIVHNSGKSVWIMGAIKSLHALDPSIEIFVLDPKREFKGSENCIVHQDIKDIERFLADQVEVMEERFKGTVASTRRVIIFDEMNVALTMAQSKKNLEKAAGVAKYRKALDKVDEMIIKCEVKLRSEPEHYEAKTALEQSQGERDSIMSLLEEAESKSRTMLENNMLLLQKARSANFNMIEFGQRLSSRALDGDAKANFSARLCLLVNSAVDSRVILDELGAEDLNGKGDALFKSPELDGTTRIQSFFV